GLPFAHEPAVLVAHPHFGAQRFPSWYDRQQDAARLQHRSLRVRRQVFNDSILGSLELETLPPNGLLLPFLLGLLVLRSGLDALVVQQLPVVRLQLREAFLPLLNPTARAAVVFPLYFHPLLRLDPDPPTVFGQQTACEAFLVQLPPRALLILIDRQRLPELRFRLKSRLKILLRLGQNGL